MQFKIKASLFFLIFVGLAALFLFLPRIIQYGGLTKIGDFGKNALEGSEPDKKTLSGELGKNFVLNEIKKEIIKSTPLRVFTESGESKLTKEGIFVYTNLERQKTGIPRLKSSQSLDRAAEIRTDDMFGKQYFAHESPTGEDVGSAAGEIEYAYAVIGENLALGGFDGDEDLVQAWMGSPGHRKNILDGKFLEIGIAAKRGSFEGKESWIAVQVFAKPAASCPLPDKKIADEFESNKQTLSEIDEKVKVVNSQINLLIGRRDALYNELNPVYEEGKNLISKGNALIEKGNRTYEETGSKEKTSQYWEEGEILQKQGKEKIDYAVSKNAEIDSMNNDIRSLTENYNTLLRSVDLLVSRINGLLRKYNEQVATYNKCVSE